MQIASRPSTNSKQSIAEMLSQLRIDPRIVDSDDVGKVEFSRHVVGKRVSRNLPGDARKRHERLEKSVVRRRHRRPIAGRNTKEIDLP